MIRDLYANPIQGWPLAAASLAVAAISLAYCILHQLVVQQQVDLRLAAGWTAVMVLPFFLAFEAGKRMMDRHQGHLVAIAVPALLGCVVSLLFSHLIFGSLAERSLGELTFDRLAPAAITTLLLVFALWLRIGRKQKVSDRKTDPVTLTATQLTGVDIVRSAGNYVELVGKDRKQLLRTTMVSLEEKLGHHGFVRVHRGAMVAKDQVDRILRNSGSYIVVTKSGEQQRVSKSYRRNLDL